ncbi:hypothetical protein THRCLA_04546 [Thraustotheca clavata]|uniref:Uncharacterized protein n=1 Tax=Thraustotheca clavata TaxID=74557 RepID=A0A1V9ZYR6_9STRA|nr:hypothetical protein THRCLA_04546 [Thraustotheca clavata]
MEFPTTTRPKMRSLHRNSSVPLFNFSQLFDFQECSKDTDSIYQKRVKEMESRRNSLGKLPQLAKIAKRIPTFALEERLLANPINIKYIVQVGFRYAEQEVSKLYALLLLEKVNIVTEEPGGYKYWQILANLHYQIMQRYRRFHPCGIFHLHQATIVYKKALLYSENQSDVMLLLNYAFAQFMEGVVERPYEMLQTINLHHGISIEKVESLEYIDRLFMYFQICAANKKWHEAEMVLRKLILAPPNGFTIANVEIMLARCLQIQGDFLSSNEIFSRILNYKFGSSASHDDAYMNLWHELASVCLNYGHLYLAIEYLGLTLTYAKQTKIRAKLYYERGLAHFCLGDINSAEDDYRRGRNSNNVAKPAITIAELKKSYEPEFDVLVNKPINEIVNTVRRGMGRTSASIKLQRSFRKYIERKRGAEDPHLLKRRLLLVKQKTAKMIVAPQTIKSPATLLQKDGSLEIDLKEREVKRIETLASLQLLHKSNIQLKPYLPHAHPRKYKVPNPLPKTPAVSFLTPDFDRPDHRRKRSLISYRRLGYSNGDVGYVQHWRALLQVGLELYSSAADLLRSIVQIKAFHTNISDAIATCALVDSDGNVVEACGKLSDKQYCTELQSIVDVIDIKNMCSAKWSNSSHSTISNPKDNTYQEILHGVPEIDPSTGRFLVQDIRNIITPTKTTSSPTHLIHSKNKSIINISQKAKEGSYHVSHIINEQITQNSNDILPQDTILSVLH